MSDNPSKKNTPTEWRLIARHALRAWRLIPPACIRRQESQYHEENGAIAMRRLK